MSTATIPQPQADAAPPLPVDYYLDGDTLIIASEETPGRLYIVTSTGCSCPAGQADWPCKHADYRLNLLMPKPRPLTAPASTCTLDLSYTLR